MTDVSQINMYREKTNKINNIFLQQNWLTTIIHHLENK